MKKLFVVLFIFTAAFSFAQQNVSVPQKYALVIGNGNYAHTTRLNNPVNDANDMAAALQGLGFTVDKVLDGTQDQMVNAVMQLKRRLSASRNSYGFLFYAGHGVQSGGENFLIPVDANIPGENFLRNRSVSVQEMLDELNDAGNEFNIVVLDACRDNPFSWKRSGTRGLIVVGSQPADSIIVFATAAGSTASDGAGRNGLFTQHLLNNIKMPGLEVTEVFRRTGADVARASNNEQRPAVYNQFYGTAYLGSRPSAATADVPQSAPANIMVRVEGGTFQMGSPANEPSRENNETQRQVTVNSFYMGKYEVTQKEYQELMGTNPSMFKGNNMPVGNVSWYDAIEYCNARSRKEGLTPAYTIDKSRSDSNNTSEDDTVRWVVTWNRNANGYRLPTEAEWEYASRAGTTTAFNTGNSITTSQANFNQSRGGTTPVGSFAANAWGLYDMHGNVREWCWDWYGSYPAGAQTDPAGASSGSFRVYRGGGWFDSAQSVRSAYRGSFTPSSRDIYTPTFRIKNLGFRVARN
jgi:formylglycine-generating enzyme required for sulfatase activity